MTADGTGGERINLEGLTEPLAFMHDASDDEVARARGGMRAAGRKTTGKELMGKVTRLIAAGAVVGVMRVERKWMGQEGEAKARGRGA